MRSCGLAIVSVALAGGPHWGVLVAALFACAAPALIVAVKFRLSHFS